MNLTLTDIFVALEKNNENTGSAYLDKKPTAYFIRGIGLVKTIEDIEKTDPRLLKVQPCINNKVYNNNNRMSMGGGNDFWESGVVHPDLILKDLIFIFHPELLPEHKFYYYRKIE